MNTENTGDTGSHPNSDASSRPVVYDLAPDCTSDDIETGANYHAVVNGVVDYGIFVDISDTVSGLVHESNLTRTYEEGDRLTVTLSEFRSDGDIAFDVFDETAYRTVVVEHEPTLATIEQLTPGEEATIRGRVTQIKQTGGPTLFHVAGETGIISAAAFKNAGVRAFPAITVDDLVQVSGNIESHEGTRQLEVDSMRKLDGETAEEVRESLTTSIATRATPPDIDPLIEWPAFEPVFDDLREIATLLRQMVLSGRPIRIRHHADGDGMCAAVPVQYALERYIESVHDDTDAPRHLVKRLPSKAPYYEMEDATRDLNFALEGSARHGQQLPLLLMLDNGSTEEDVPAYENLAHYDVPIAVVDHHHPDPEAVEPLLDAHVNPYLHDEDYRITTGMMCVELARMIDPTITDEVRHVPAVAGFADRSKANAMAQFISLAESEGYDSNRLQNVGEALDYTAHWLRYSDGQSLVNDVLNVGGTDTDRHTQLVDFLSTRAERDVERQLDAAMQHLTHERLNSGAHLYRIDLDEWAHRFTYPAPGKTTGKIHDRQVTERGEPVITIGYGPDFAVLRSDGVRLDIPRMVSELNQEVVGGGVSGGGHLVVGSIKFVEGMREAVIDRLVDKMAEAELDAALSSQAMADVTAELD